LPVDFLGVYHEAQRSWQQPGRKDAGHIWLMHRQTLAYPSLGRYARYRRVPKAHGCLQAGTVQFVPAACPPGAAPILLRWRPWSLVCCWRAICASTRSPLAARRVSHSTSSRSSSTRTSRKPASPSPTSPSPGPAARSPRRV